MLIRLDLPFADVRARDLALTLGAPPEPALQVLRAEVAGLAVELRLLGCSHQVLAGELSETVACRPGAQGPLPESAETPGYSFRARVTREGPAAYARRARSAIEAVGPDPQALVGIFPGPADAFTALRIRAVEGAVAWTSWHGYPQTGELVVTESRLERIA